MSNLPGLEDGEQIFCVNCSRCITGWVGGYDYEDDPLCEDCYEIYLEEQC